MKNMGGIIARIAIFLLAAIGVYKTFPQVSKPVDYYLKSPQFQNRVVIPAINVANAVLPDKLKVPTPATIMGFSTDYENSSPIQQLTDEITKQATDLAAEQIVQIKKNASDAFCKVLIEKIQTECGFEVSATPQQQEDVVIDLTPTPTE